MVEKKLFLQIQRINIVHPIEENVIAMPITNRIDEFDYKDNGGYPSYRYPSLSHFMDEFDYEDNGGKNAFPANPKINIM